MKRFMAVTASALTLTALFGFAATTSAQVLSTPLYFSDSNSNIKRVSTDGTTVTQLANVANAGGFAFSDGGRGLYVATGTGISRVDVTTGAVTSFATGLNGAQSVVTDRFGNLYTTTNLVSAGAVTARQVLRYSIAGGAPTIIPATIPLFSPNSAGAFGVDLAYDAGRDLLYAEGQTTAGAGTIYRINTLTGATGNFGTFSTIPLGLTTNNQGQVFATVTGSQTIRRYGTTAQGASLLTGSTGNSGNPASPNNGGVFVNEDSFTEGTLDAPTGFFYDAAFDPSSDRVYGSSFADLTGTNGTIFSKASTITGTADARVDLTGYDPRRLAFAAVPAPSSVAVMAMGGLLPLVTFARRRRAAK
jgi:hypothetical protein